MRRLVRNDPVRRLPPGVKAAKWVPIVVIPSEGHDARAAGTKPANMRRQGAGAGVERPVRIQFGACCDEHKGHVKLELLASPADLARRASALSNHHGHGRLMPDKARLEWEQCESELPCVDCMEIAAEKEAKAKQEAAAKQGVAA